VKISLVAFSFYRVGDRRVDGAYGFEELVKLFLMQITGQQNKLRLIPQSLRIRMEALLKASGIDAK